MSKLSTSTESISTESVVYREDLYPRFKPNPQAIQRYAADLDVLPPIEVNQDGLLIDGYHRWKAHQTMKAETIRVKVTPATEREVEYLAVERNATHGQQLTPEEKRKYCVKWFGDRTQDDICKTLSISERSHAGWTKTQRDNEEKERKQRILELHLACYTQQAIADDVGLPRKSVDDVLSDFGESGKFADLAIFGKNTDDEFKRQIYTVWNFGKATNEVRHFGNIPPEIVDNLMFLYTKPFDVVFDPFGGGGSTLDKCRARMRRCYISDLNPIPARDNEIRQHDITTGLPKDLPVPELVFLDPPYWKQAKERYSKDDTDLGNIGLDAFLDTIGDIAKATKRKWSNAKRESGTLALIIGPLQEDGRKIDLPFLCYERISKYLPLAERVIVPYSTQVHGGNFVNMAKEKKELLYLHRDLMVFRYGI